MIDDSLGEGVVVSPKKPQGWGADKVRQSFYVASLHISGQLECSQMEVGKIGDVTRRHVNFKVAIDNGNGFEVLQR